MGREADARWSHRAKKTGGETGRKAEKQGRCLSGRHEITYGMNESSTSGARTIFLRFLPSSHISSSCFNPAPVKDTHHKNH